MPLWVLVDEGGHPVEPLQARLERPATEERTWHEGFPIAGVNPFYRTLGERMPQPSAAGQRVQRWPFPPDFEETKALPAALANFVAKKISNVSRQAAEPNPRT